VYWVLPQCKVYDSTTCDEESKSNEVSCAPETANQKKSPWHKPLTHTYFISTPRKTDRRRRPSNPSKKRPTAQPATPTMSKPTDPVQIVVSLPPARFLTFPAAASTPISALREHIYRASLRARRIAPVALPESARFAVGGWGGVWLTVAEDARVGDLMEEEGGRLSLQVVDESGEAWVESGDESEVELSTPSSSMDMEVPTMRWVAEEGDARKLLRRAGGDEKAIRQVF